MSPISHWFRGKQGRICRLENTEQREARCYLHSTYLQYQQQWAATLRFLRFNSNKQTRFCFLKREGNTKFCTLLLNGISHRKIITSLRVCSSVCDLFPNFFHSFSKQIMTMWTKKKRMEGKIGESKVLFAWSAKNIF